MRMPPNTIAGEQPNREPDECREFERQQLNYEDCDE